jgi:CheY-like chemotaxis protein/anti-sigma regulatory factor (Ser/Thr protein kinase)
MERVRCAPHRTLREVLQVMEARAKEKSIALELEIAGAIPETIESDPGRLRQIVTNLVGNAIKFTERGSVKVELRLAADQDQVLEIAIRDSGIGIAADKLEAIFDPFTQADASVSRRFGGTGLGLAISRRFARALGGDIVAASEPGQGSTFTVSIATGPLSGVRLLTAAEALPAQEPAEAVAERGRWTFPRRRVLVVDDGPENRELVRLVLSELGLEIEEAENGRIGVDKTLAGSFDAVLMDIQMPELDGLSATRELRARGCALPVVALTAHAMKGYEQEIRAAGCSDWLVKPIDIDRLVELLARMLGGTRTDAAASAVTALPAAPAAARAPIVSRFADKPRLHAAVRLFAQRLGGQLAAMEAARGEGRLDELARLAHALKGAGGTVGFGEFTEPAVRLEEAALTADAAEIAQALETIRDIAARIVVPGDDAGSARAAA